VSSRVSAASTASSRESSSAIPVSYSRTCVGAVEVPELVAIVASTAAEVALVLRRDDRDHAPAYRDARLVLPARRGPCFAERRDLFGLQPIEADPGVF
jgi:hypothetical protein